MRARTGGGGATRRARTRIPPSPHTSPGRTPAMALTASVQAWLISKVGTATTTADLEARYARLGSARAVAVEILNERLADLRAQATTIGVSGVVNVSYVENIKAYEREIALLESGSSPAPDDPPVEDDSDTAVGLFYLRERARR